MVESFFRQVFIENIGKSGRKRSWAMRIDCRIDGVKTNFFYQLYSIRKTAVIFSRKANDNIGS
jgi:hypothetical protein